MIKHAKHNALFFLSVFVLYLVADGAVKGLKYYSSSSPEWEIACQITVQGNTFDKVSDKLTSDREMPVAHKSDVKLINCNSSLHILSITSNLFFHPEQIDHIVWIQSTLLATQAFAFQEPDPPKVG